jgi:pilus assembly protein FimV
VDIADTLDDDGDFNLDDFQFDDLEPETEDSEETGFEGASEPELEDAPEEDGGLLMEFGELEIDGHIEEEISFEELPEEVDDDSFELDSLEGLGELGELEELGELGELEAEAVLAEGDSDDEEALVYATDGDEIATKLDLARAYLDMGDHEGARSILEEVQQDGSAAQHQEAQSLLDCID